MTQPLGASGAATPWWLQMSQSNVARGHRPSVPGAVPASTAGLFPDASQSDAALLATLLTKSGATSANFPAAATDSDQTWLSKLITSDGKATDLLNQLTGIDFSAGSAPDYLAVRSGAGVTSQYSGGTNNVTVVDGSGYTINYFSSGKPPNAMKGAAVTFSPNASARVRAAGIAEAQNYLGQHADDQQNVNGQWNRPIFNVSAGLDVRA